MTIPSAVPSITQILGNPNQGSGGFAVNIPYNHLGIVSIVLLILFMLAGAFLKGGFLGCVLAGVNDHEVRIGTFMAMAKKYFLRFILQSSITFILVIAFVPFFFIPGPLVLFLFIGIIILFFYLMFWDYIIVVENAKLIDAARISCSLVQSNLRKVLSLVIPVSIITALFGIWRMP